MQLRTRLDPANPPKVELAPVIPTSAAYAVFMAASSNTRYQLVNSLEGQLLPIMPGGRMVQTISSFVLRTYNN